MKVKNWRQHRLPLGFALWKYFLLGRGGPGAGSWSAEQPPPAFWPVPPNTVSAFPGQEPHARLGHLRAEVWTQAQERAHTKINPETELGASPQSFPFPGIRSPGLFPKEGARPAPHQHPPPASRQSSPPASHHFHILIRPAVLRLPSLTDTGSC